MSLFIAHEYHIPPPIYSPSTWGGDLESRIEKTYLLVSYRREQVLKQEAADQKAANMRKRR